MADFPRTRNGHVDTGARLLGATGTETCPNCGSTAYIESVSLESCTACGLRCDYWGTGANEVYEAMMQRKYARIEAEDAERDRAYQTARDHLTPWDE